MLAPLGPTRFGVALRATVIGFAASFVLPARAGEVIRPWLLARREGLPVAAAFATIILERVLDLVTVVALLALYFLAFDPGISTLDPAMYAAVRGGALLAALGRGDRHGGHARRARPTPSACSRLVAWATGCCRRGSAPPSRRCRKSFAEGLAVVRDPRAAGPGAGLVGAAVAGHRRADLGGVAGARRGPAGRGLAAGHRAAGGRRRGADARRRRRLSRGLPPLGHLVLRHRQRPRRRRRDRAPRRRLHPDADRRGVDDGARGAVAAATWPRPPGRPGREVPLLRRARRQGGRLAREQGRRRHPPPAPVPERAAAASASPATSGSTRSRIWW